MSDDLAQQVEDLNSNVHEVVTVLPITSGRYDYEYKCIGRGGPASLNGGYGVGYGFSYTVGVTIIAKRIKQQ